MIVRFADMRPSAEGLRLAAERCQGYEQAIREEETKLLQAKSPTEALEVMSKIERLKRAKAAHESGRSAVAFTQLAQVNELLLALGDEPGEWTSH